jgi:hypothetical protein
MKQGILVGIVMLFTLALVSAGETHIIDFSELRTQPVYLYEHDQIRFSLLGGEHVIIIEDVGTSSVKLDYGFYIDENTNLNPGLVGLDYLMRADINKDGIVDLNVALYSIAEDGLVQLVLQDLTGTDNSEIIGDVGKVDEVVIGGFDYKTIVLAVIGVLILGLVGFLIFKGSGKKEEPKAEQPANFEPKEGL